MPKLATTWSEVMPVPLICTGKVIEIGAMDSVDVAGGMKAMAYEILFPCKSAAYNVPSPLFVYTRRPYSVAKVAFISSRNDCGLPSALAAPYALTTTGAFLSCSPVGVKFFEVEVLAPFPPKGRRRLKAQNKATPPPNISNALFALTFIISIF